MKQYMELVVGTVLSLAMLGVASLLLLNAGGATDRVVAAKGAVEAESIIAAPLRATPDGGAMSGTSEYREQGEAARLSIEVEGAAADGTYGIAIWEPGNPSALFQATIQVTAGTGEFQLNTWDDENVPVLWVGDVVQVYGPGGNLVLSGNY